MRPTGGKGVTKKEKSKTLNYTLGVCQRSRQLFPLVERTFFVCCAPGCAHSSRAASALGSNCHNHNTIRGTLFVVCAPVETPFGGMLCWNARNPRRRGRMKEPSVCGRACRISLHHFVRRPSASCFLEQVSFVCTVCCDSK